MQNYNIQLFPYFPEIIFINMCVQCVHCTAKRAASPVMASAACKIVVTLAMVERWKENVKVISHLASVL